jgi:hypothetical protein
MKYLLTILYDNCQESKKNPSDELFIKIKPNAQLVKLMNAYYSKHQNMPVGSVRFFHHEVYIFPFNTPKDVCISADRLYIKYY